MRWNTASTYSSLARADRTGGVRSTTQVGTWGVLFDGRVSSLRLTL